MNGSVRNIQLGEAAHFTCHTVLRVDARTHTALLNKRMDATTGKTTIGQHFHLKHRGVSRNAGETHAIGCAEISKAVSNEMLLIEFNGTHHVRSVSIDNISTGINAEMCKLTQRASVLAIESFRSIGQTIIRTPFSSAMERDNHHIGATAQICDDASHCDEILMTKRVRIVPESTKADTQTGAFNHHALGATFDTGKGNPFLAECLLG